MDHLRLIAVMHGVFLTGEALELGYDDKSIARAVRHRLWHRVRRGAYVPMDVWIAADRVERHRILTRAVHRSYGDTVAVSHVSAAVLHGLAIWNADLSRVHVTRLDGGAGRTEADVIHHEGFCLGDSDLVQRDGILLTVPARAALETGMLSTTESAVVTADSLLNLELATDDELRACHDVLQRWPGAQHLQVVVRLADGRAESQGESRARYLFFVHGIPAPELQFKVYDDQGRLFAVTDFAWPDRGLLGEFDGRGKYERRDLRDPNPDRVLKPGEVVFSEKHREDELRRMTGCGMVRIIWTDFERPRLTVARVEQMLRLRAA